MHKKKTISKVLKLKDNRKKEVELEVKKASDMVDEEKEKLSALEKDFSDSMNNFNEQNSGGAVDIQNINAYYDFFSRINGRISEQKKVHEKRENELKTLKNDLADAHKDQKVFEILNDKVIKAENREKLAAEQKEADFFSISRRLK
jgi:flagellar export protein FliJ